MRPLNGNRRLGGARAKVFGESFENMLRVPAFSIGATLLRIPDGCKTIRRGASLINQRVPTPFDFVMSKLGLGVAFFDAKTVAGRTFSYSDIKPHQVHALYQMRKQGNAAGYLIWFRGPDRVRWFDVGVLMSIGRGQGVNCEEGIDVGQVVRMDLLKVFLRSPA